MTGTILAIDQGTSATKAIVVDACDGLVSAAVKTAEPIYLADGGVVQRPERLLASVLDSGRRAVTTAGRPINAVALANQGESVIAWDPQTGVPFSPVIVWQDRRAEDVCAELAGEVLWVRERTGLTLDPYFSAPKMAWLRRTLTADGVVTTTDTWLAWHLTREYVTDASTASRSMLTALDDGRWDPELLALFQLEREALPRIVACDETIGTTDVFGGSIPLAGLILDQPAALLAHGCLDPGTVKCTFGTGAFVLANAGRAVVRPTTSGLSSSLAWQARGERHYCFDGQVYTAAAAVDWLHRLGLVTSAADIDRVAVRDGEVDDIICVPALAGLGAPWWRSRATASFLGMSLNTRPGHLVRAVLHGIAAQVAELVDQVAIELRRTLAYLSVDGGLTRSRTLMQATADLLQLPIEVYPSPDATALGAAALGRLALEPALSLDDAVPRKTAGTVYEPAWSAARAAAYRDRWRDAVTTTTAPA